MIKLRTIKAFLVSLLLFLTLEAFGTSKNKTDLEKVNNTISRLKKAQQNAIQTRNKVTESLKNTELLISRLHVSIDVLKNDIAYQQTTLEKIDLEKIPLEKNLRYQQQLLIKQLKLQQRLGKHPYLQLLLNQRDPNLISRLLSYLGFIHQARANTLMQIIKLKQVLEGKTQQKQQSLTMLATLKNKHKHEIENLRKEKHEQRQLIEEVRQQIKHRNKTLKQFLQNKAALEQLVSRLEQHLKHNHIAFSHMQHKLPLPVKGRLINHFGISTGSILNNGVLFKGKEGSKIRAVFDGKVVFSDWLKGFGLLLILNHGQGYMTLYANNQALFRKSGEYVSKGALIARLGHSGGQLDDGLYFEIRHNGTPLDPKQWFTNTSHR